ncbi:peptidylglycine monooxygenase-like protein [soil metagenome]
MNTEERSFTTDRRRFLGLTAAAIAAPFVSRGAEVTSILGQGDFRYRVVPNWGILGESTPVSNCHGIVCDREGHLILFTDQVQNNVIIYDSAGKLMHKWGTEYPGAHGLSLVVEDGREVLYFTDLKRHKVFKATTSGELLAEWRWPETTGKYAEEEEYRPSWTLHLPGGGFFVLDGYGRDYITHYGADGKLVRIFGGQEDGIPHWGPHGGMLDARATNDPTLLIAMSDQQSLLRLGLDGKKREEIDMPGGNPRQIRWHDGHFFVAQLADNWPKDRNSRGYVSVLDADLRIISNIAGSAPHYDDAGKLQPMHHTEDVFIHPHDLTVGKDGSLYVAQFASNNTYPIKLERV